MRTYRVLLEPRAAFSGYPASETLFGAFCWSLRYLYGVAYLEELLRDYTQHEDFFVLSSAFPFFQGNSQSLACYPKPLHLVLTWQQAEEVWGNKGLLKSEKVKAAKQLKDFNKIKYLSETVWQTVLAGKRASFLFAGYCQGQYVLAEQTLMSREERENLVNFLAACKQEVVQHAAVDRMGMTTDGAGDTYYETLTFAPPCFRLHFLLRTKKIDKLMPVLRYLEDTGIGGDRRIGRGRYRILIEEITAFPAEGEWFTTLSRYLPVVGEVVWDHPITAYNLVPYRGKIESGSFLKEGNVWKAPVRYCGEGSVFRPVQNKVFFGDLPVIKKVNEVEVLQYGLGFPVYGKKVE